MPTPVIGVPSATAPIKVAPIVPSLFSSQLSHANILWGPTWRRERLI